MPDFSLCPLQVDELPSFGQYLLPQAVAAMQVDASSVMALGATTGRYAVGAGCVQLCAQQATLLSLFIDPSARGQGAGGLLLDGFIDSCRAQGVIALHAEYSLSGDDLSSMDALLRRRGAQIHPLEDESFRMDSVHFHQAPLIRAAFLPSFRPAAAICKFSALSQAQLDALNANPDIPAFLNWAAHTDRADPDFSLAWLEDGQVAAFTLACPSADGGCIQLSTVRTPAAPPSSVLALVRALINLAYYRAGGDFPFYTSTMAPASRALVERLAGGRYTHYTCRKAVLPLFPS